jgi:hypothetical protein
LSRRSAGEGAATTGTLKSKTKEAGKTSNKFSLRRVTAPTAITTGTLCPSGAAIACGTTGERAV